MDSMITFLRDSLTGGNALLVFGTTFLVAGLFKKQEEFQLANENRAERELKEREREMAAAFINQVSDLNFTGNQMSDGAQGEINTIIINQLRRFDGRADGPVFLFRLPASQQQPSQSGDHVPVE